MKQTNTMVKRTAVPTTVNVKVRVDVKAVVGQVIEEAPALGVCSAWLPQRSTLTASPLLAVIIPAHHCFLLVAASKT